MNAPRVLAATGLWGALLTVVILAMSVLMRLGSHVDGGIATSTLPADVEFWARIAHRVAAMGVGALAALALVAAWRDGAPGRRVKAALVSVVVLTLLLAMIGRYTPGYRFDLVTVANVLGGVALAASFWLLRAPGASDSIAGDGLARAALVCLLALAALGAAADAAAMRGEIAYRPAHLGLAAIFTGLALASAWRQRGRRALASGVAALTVAQAALGYLVAAAPGSRPLALGWVHAMIACVLALMLVSLGSRAAPLR